MDFGVILDDANGWETDSLSNSEPDLEAPRSLPGLKTNGDKSHHSLGARIQALAIFTTKGNTPTTFKEIWDQTGVSRASVYKIRGRVPQNRRFYLKIPALKICCCLETITPQCSGSCSSYFYCSTRLHPPRSGARPAH
jgi:hypothetical protein